ncbi:tetraspanin-7 [Hyalella azteca]|uniref:Tetraspanin-7 n=1 Tax=Hyalella azteca TaxID=294128 RepID=A0A8B7NDH2_HYAAZ|nr:tetraspanin-7 [Hyalella azteca]
MYGGGGTLKTRPQAHSSSQFSLRGVVMRSGVAFSSPDRYKVAPRSALELPLMAGKKPEPTRGVAWCKTMLLTFNCLFLVVGLVVLGIGVFAAVELDKYVRMSPDFAATAPYIGIGVGSLMCLLALLACCCAAKEQPILLIVYAAFVLADLVTLVSAGVSGWTFRMRVLASYEEGLARAFTDYGRTVDITRAVDNLQSSLGCCGIYNASDWVAMPFGQRNDPPFPASCCSQRHNSICVLYNRGCYLTVVKFLQDKKFPFFITGMVFIAVMVVGVMIAMCLSKCITSAKAKYL